MSWCDKLASTPTVGFKLNAHFAPGEVLLDCLTPILDPLYVGDKLRFTLSQLEAFATTFTTEDGFHYTLDQSKCAIGFYHRMKAKPVSGGPPVMEMLSRPMPFSELLPHVSKRLIEATVLLPKSSSRKIERTGILSQTFVSEHDLPPGLKRLLKYLGRPWSSLDTYNIQLTAGLNETTGWSDRCIHTLKKSEDKDELLHLQFDWQRTYKEGRSISTGSMTDILEEAKKAALAYFEDIAEGSRFDADLISHTT